MLSVALSISAPAQAQTAGDQGLRGSITPNVVAQSAVPAAPAALGDGWLATVQDGTVPGSGQGQDDDAVPAPEGATPLGGMGDEPTPLEPGAAVEAEIIEEGPGVNLLPEEPVGGSDTLHTALLPEPHDLDPYLPIGIRLGSFLLFPEVETGMIGTNNVLATKTQAHSDVAYEVAPSLRLQSDWSRHSFTAEFNADRSWYGSFPVEDDRIYDLTLRGRIDVTRRTHLGAEAEQSQTQVGRNAISLTDIAGAQTNLHEEHVIGSVDHTFNRLTLKASETLADYNYDDADTTLAGGIPFQDVRDYSEAQTTLRTTYEFTPDWAGFVEGTVNNRTYREPINVAGIRRGSSGYTLASGLNLRLAGTLFGEVSFGWGEQTPIDDRLGPIEGPLLNGDLIWMPSPLTKLEFLARSEIDETTLEDSLGAIDRFYELSLQHAFYRFFVLGGFVSYEIADYVGDPQVDQRLKAGATADYYFNSVVSLYSRYEHTDFTSTIAANDFTEDEIRFGLKLRR